MTSTIPPKIQPRLRSAPKIKTLYWCDFPEDAQLPEFWKRRPVVILSHKNTLHGAVTVIPCSTRVQKGKWAFPLRTTIDDKAAVLQRVKRYIKNNNKSTKSRTSKNVKVTIFGSTGIVSGYTIIERNSKLVTYHFMRTYVQSEGKCYLIASQTMAIPKKE